MKKRKDEMKKKTIELGDKVKDVISGFTGIVIAKSEFLHGCIRCGISPQELHDGGTIDTHWFDEPQLELIKKKVVEVGDKTPDKVTGGPMSSTPTRQSNPKR